LKLTITIKADGDHAEYTEFAEREFETESEMRGAYNAILDLLEDTEPTRGDMECDCADRSWYGPEHDSACPFAGQLRASPLSD
jgi:hypothetical protein